MKNYNENDPIQEVTKKSIFSKLNSFEDDYEYELEKEIEEYEKQKRLSNDYTNKNTNNYQNIGISKKVPVDILVILIFFFIIIVICIGSLMSSQLTTSNKIVSVEENDITEEVEYEEDEMLDSIYMSNLPYIKFSGVGSIPTLYRIDKNVIANWCEYTYSDNRFGNRRGVSTLEISYNDISNKSLDKYINSLEEEGFIYVDNYYESPVYLIEKDNGYSLFVIVSNYRIIYGSCHGDYTNIFN